MIATRGKIRGRAGRAVAVFGAVATISAFLAPYALATNIGDLQAQARDLEAHINELGNQENQLSEQYDAGVIQLQKAEANVAQAQSQVNAANARAGQTLAVLQADAVDAYVNNGQGSLSGSGPASTVSGADSNLLRAEYSQSLATSQSDLEDQYRLDSKQSSRAESNLKTEESVAAANLVAITADEKRVQSAQVTLVAAEAQVKGRIATLIAQQLAAERRAAQLAAERRLAAQRAAAAAAARAAAARAAAARAAAQERAAAAASAAAQQSALTTPTTTSPTLTPPPAPIVAPSGAAAAAVAAAESRIGDPYVWGAIGPTSFDCSGLVMWAYAQAGVLLPHYSGSQYDVTEHIPMSDLEPGDLVFFANPGEHVAMYIGDGDVVQAPYTGADVQIVPLFSGFVLASRVA